MSRNPEPYKRLAITHRIPSKRARTARASSRVNTTGSLTGFLARSTPSSQPSSFFSTCTVQEHDGVQRLVLSRGGHLALHGQMGQKRLHLGRPHLRRMPLPVEQDEPSDPIDVGLLGADAVVQPPDDAADLIEQPGLAPSRGRDSSCLSMPCFLTVGRAPPCTIPFVFKALPALPTPPPRYNTAQTRPATTPYRPAAYPGARPGRSRC